MLFVHLLVHVRRCGNTHEALLMRQILNRPEGADRISLLG